MDGKLAKGPADTRNVDGWSFRCTESWQRLMKGPTDIGKVDGRSHGCTESLWKFLRPHGKLTDVDGRSRWCTESWWIVPRMYRRLTEVDGWTFCLLSVHPRDYLSNFCVSAEHCVIFSKHYVRPRDLPSTSVNFCTFSAPSVNIPCDRGTFRHLQSTFCAVVGLSANFRQLFVHLRDLPSTFHATADITSTFLAPAQPSVNFHQFSVRPRDLPWTFAISKVFGQ